jgi:hypothetical protein
MPYAASVLPVEILGDWRRQNDLLAKTLTAVSTLCDDCEPAKIMLVTLVGALDETTVSLSASLLGMG